jgi:hypothetical protein
MSDVKRGLTIYFMDGSTMKIDFPKQAPDDNIAAIKIKDILAQRQLLCEVDGTFLVFPFENIKYVVSYPAPGKLPAHTIQGASVTGGTP